jgi:carbonic anhydrase/acetyltransferase-like protein (isoleucine patch superfamily)
MIISKGCYVGPYAVVRLDEKPSAEPLVVGEDTNLQDCSVVHATTQHIGRRVIVAHQSIVHGAVVEDDVTIYIQAVVDGGGTVLGRGSFLHQGSYVGKGLRVPEGRYVEPGRRVLNQAEADALGPVPDALRAVREHVMECNALHTKRYLAL